MANKSNLWQISKRLNDASNLINTMLENDSQLQQAALALAQTVTRSDTTREVVPSVKASINSAVDRAGSMIRESSSRGLCSRLNRRERLRATSSTPSSVATKKLRLEKKVFEFVLLRIQNSCENDTLLFSESMVAIHGFIEILTTASEEDIQTELCTTIQLKFSMVSTNDFEFVRANR